MKRLLIDNSLAIPVLLFLPQDFRCLVEPPGAVLSKKMLLTLRLNGCDVVDNRTVLFETDSEHFPKNCLGKEDCRIRRRRRLLGAVALKWES